MTDLMDQIRAIDPGSSARAVQDAALRCREAAQSPRLSERATAGAAFKRLTDVLEMGTTAIDPHSPFAFQGGRQR